MKRKNKELSNPTTDYSLFVFLPENRPLRQEKVDRLIREYKTTGKHYFAEFRIKVNTQITPRKLCIVDGQHRFMACKELGLPIWWEQVNSITSMTIPVINSNQTNWGAKDYIHFWAEKNITAFVRLRNIIQENENIPLTSITALYVRSGNTGHLYDRFRNGTLTNVDIERGNKLMEQLEQFSEFVDFNWSRSFITAFVRLQQHPAYNHSVMLQKLKYKRLHKATTKMEYLKQLSDIYNYHLREKVDLINIPKTKK